MQIYFSKGELIIKNQLQLNLTIIKMYQYYKNFWNSNIIHVYVDHAEPINFSKSLKMRESAVILSYRDQKHILFDYLRAHFLNFATLSQLFLVKIHHIDFIRMIWRAVAINRIIFRQGRLISRIAYIFFLFDRKLVMINYLKIFEVVLLHCIKKRKINIRRLRVMFIIFSSI